MTDKPTTPDLDVLDEHGAAERDAEKATAPVIGDYNGQYGAYVDGRLILHPVREELERILGIHNKPLERERALRQEQADELAKRKAEAAERLPRLKEQHDAAKQASRDAHAAFLKAVRADPILKAWVELRAAEASESSASGRVRRAQAQAAHGGEGPMTTMTHRFEGLASALDAVAQQAYAEHCESQG